MQSQIDAKRGWVQTYPELATRPALLDELAANKHLRAVLFRFLNLLENIAVMPDRAVKLYLFDLVKEQADKRFRDREEFNFEPTVFNELMGAFKNITWNMRPALGMELKPLNNPHHVHLPRPGKKSNWHWLTEEGEQDEHG